MFNPHFNLIAPQIKGNRRRQRWLHLPLALALACPAAAEDAAPPLRLEAERVETRGSSTRAEGNVEARFEDYKLCAGRIIYDRDTGLVEAVEDVRLIQGEGESELTGDSARYNLQTREGEMADFESTPFRNNLRVSGDRATIQPSGFSGENVRLTSCPTKDGEHPDWHLSASEAHLNNVEQTLDAQNAVLHIGEVPFLYFPYGTFYYGDEKRDGFLEPRLDLDSKDGLGIATPYYFALADNYDLTLTPNFLTQHGLELGGDFRFLTPHSRGEVHIATALLDDYGRGHEHLNYEYQRGDWRLQLVAENTSDNDYLRDYAEDDEASTRTLPRIAVLHYEREHWYARAAMEHFKSLDNALIAPHRATPQLEVGGGHGSDNYDWDMSAQYSHFRHNTLADGARAVWNGNVRGYHSFGDIALSPGVGGKAVSYRDTENSAGGRNTSFFVPYARLDAETNRRNAFIEAAEQHDHLRLRAALIYARAQKRQRGAPLYDSHVREHNSDNLFEWNRFVGDDRAADAQFLAYGASYRLFAHDRERFFLGAAQRYHLRDGEIALTARDEPPKQGFGNILINSHLRVRDRWRVAAAMEWDPRHTNTERFYTEAHGKLAENKLLHLRYLLDDNESLVVGGSTPLANGLEVAAQTDYLLDQNHFASSWFGIRIHDSCDCWNITFTVEDTVVEAGDNETRFSLGMEFIGLGGLGSSYNSLLNKLR